MLTLAVVIERDSLGKVAQKELEPNKSSAPLGAVVGRNVRSRMVREIREIGTQHGGAEHGEHGDKE